MDTITLTSRSCSKTITDSTGKITGVIVAISITIVTLFTPVKTIPVSFFTNLIPKESLPCPLPEKEVTEVYPNIATPIVVSSTKDIKDYEGTGTDNGGYIERNKEKTAAPMVNAITLTADEDLSEKLKKVKKSKKGVTVFYQTPEANDKPVSEESIKTTYEVLDFNKEFEKAGIKMTPKVKIIEHIYGEGSDFNPKVGTNILTKAQMKEYCEIAGAEFGVDPTYLEAMAETESSLNTHAVNGTHYGLFQISSHWHAGRMAALGVTDLYDPLGNTRVAAMIVRDLAAENPDPAYILMCYNQGQKTAIPMYNSGQISGYATKIINRRNYIAEHGYL